MDVHAKYSRTLMESEALLVSGEAGAVDRGRPLSVAADVATREA